MMNRRDVLKNAAAAAAAATAGGATLGSLAACTQAGRGGARPAAILPEPKGVLVPDTAIALRRSDERGHANHGWLDTRHTFSFASYYDPRFMGFRGLRVINEDHVTAGQGFPMHPHRDMEIVTYVLEGAIEHKDTLGNGGIIRPNDVQRMSAGTGIRHSEYNPQKDADVHFLQIWMEPDRQGVAPGYAQQVVSVADRTDRLRIVASPDGHDGSISIQADTKLYASILGAGRTVRHEVPASRYAWVHLARGAATLNGKAMSAGDGAAVTAAGGLEITAASAGAELLVFDLA